MRIEGSVTAISWIPSEAIEGMPKLPFELGVGHYDEPPPDRLSHADLGRLRDEDRFREANLAQGVDRGRGRRDRQGRLRRGRPRRLDDLPPRTEGDRRPWSAVRGSACRAGDLRRPRPVRADRRRTGGLPGAATRQRRADVPHPVGDGVDDARSHTARGRSSRARARRREPVSASLDLRQRRRPGAEERHRRLQDVVSRVARREHAVGRRGVRRGRHRGGDRARAGAVQRAALAGREAREAEARRGRDARRAGLGGDRPLPAPRRRARRSRSTASRSPRWGPGRCSASARRSRAANARRRCARSRPAGSR